ncbi:MAG: hypothetical protein QXU97_02925 [Fervidicoccaceae archaeon]
MSSGSENLREELRGLLYSSKRLEEELREALARSGKKYSGWVNLRNAYLLSLSIRRRLERMLALI